MSQPVTYTVNVVASRKQCQIVSFLPAVDNIATDIARLVAFLR